RDAALDRRVDGHHRRLYRHDSAAARQHWLDVNRTDAGERRLGDARALARRARAARHRAARLRDDAGGEVSDRRRRARLQRRARDPPPAQARESGAHRRAAAALKDGRVDRLHGEPRRGRARRPAPPAQPHGDAAGRRHAARRARGRENRPRRRAARALDVRLISAEHVAHRAADLAHRRAVLERLADRRQQVLAAARGGAQLLEAAVHEHLIAVRLERLQAVDLLALGLRVDAQQVGHLERFVDEAVDADDDVLLGLVALLVPPGGLLDLVLDERDRVDRAAQLVHLRDQLGGALLDLGRQRLDVVGARERVDRVGRARLVADDLLRAQRDLGGALRRQRKRLVEAVGVQRLRPAADGGEALQGDAHDVVLRLLRGQRDAARLRVEAQLEGALVLRPEALAHDLRPHLAGGAELRDLLEDVVVAVEEER